MSVPKLPKASSFILLYRGDGVPSWLGGKETACNAGDRSLSLSQEDPLEKEMETHSSTLAWKTPWTEEHGRLQSMGPQSRTPLSDVTTTASL